MFISSLRSVFTLGLFMSGFQIQELCAVIVLKIRLFLRILKLMKAFYLKVKHLLMKSFVLKNINNRIEFY